MEIGNVEKMAVYKATARRRWAREQQLLARRYQRAWAIARQAAVLLREQFGASQVKVFGSLVREDLFHARSDIDLAVWGLAEKEYYRAVARLLTLDAALEIDLVRVEEASTALRARIEREGIAI